MSFQCQYAVIRFHRCGNLAPVYSGHINHQALLARVGKRVVTGIFSFLSAEKSPDLPLVSSYFLAGGRTSPFLTPRLSGVKQAKTDGDIQIKKSRNDENKQQHNRSKRSSKPPVQPNKKGCQMDDGSDWLNNRIGVVGFPPTDIPRCGLGYLNSDRLTDNLLVTDTLKFTTMANLKSNESAIAVMQQMLQERCIAEPSFAIKLANPSKSIEGAVNYLCTQIQKSGLCMVDSDTVISILTHYYPK